MAQSPEVAPAFVGPQPQTQIISPGDTIVLSVFRKLEPINPMISLPQLRVEPDGTVNLPLVGLQNVAGETPASLQQKLAAAYSAHMNSPDVRVTLGESRQRRFYILGEVKTPGIYPLPPNGGVLEGALLAGGFTSEADRARIVVFSAAPAGQTAGAPPRRGRVDLKKMIEQADVKQDVLLAPGDIVYVPPDYISRSNRFLQHVSNVVQPFASITQALGTVVIISNTSDSNDDSSN